MKLYLTLALLIALTICGCKPGGSAQRQAGYWDGGITLPGMELKVQVDLSQSGTNGWIGKINIPAQGVRKLKLAQVKVEGDSASFVMEGIPGNPMFAGKLSGDAKFLSGDFTQNGQKFPFKLEKKAPPVEPLAETPEKGVAGKGVAGKWQGSLKPAPVSELRLVVEVVADAAGKLDGVMISLDQGNIKVALTNLVLEGTSLHFDAPSINGSFQGDLNADGSELEGEWRQMGRGMPLSFKRLAKK